MSNSNVCCYRVLNPDKSLESWLTGYFHSSHNCPPGAWVKKWNDTFSRNALDYPLTTIEGVFSVVARQSFISCKTNKNDDEWTELDYCLTGQLNGVYAFNNPFDALSYVGENFKSRTHFVVFWGSILDGNAPETNAHLVKVEDVIDGPMSYEEFQHKYAPQI